MESGMDPSFPNSSPQRMPDFAKADQARIAANWFPVEYFR